MKTPQEKKALSYERDHRNAYGESPGASRKSIPLRKSLVNRANRHDARRLLDAATGSVDVESADAVEQRVVGKRPKRWAKEPDLPLGQHLERKAWDQYRGRCYALLDALDGLIPASALDEAHRLLGFVGHERLAVEAVARAVERVAQPVPVDLLEELRSLVLLEADLPRDLDRHGRR